MSKELEALKIGIPKLKKLYENSAKKMSQNDILGFDLVFVYLDKALQRLELIDNANPSEAMVCLEEITLRTSLTPASSLIRTIKQALLKAQEQEKENGRAFGKDIINLNKTLKQTIDKPILYASRYGNKYIVPQKLFEEQQRVLEVLFEKRIDLESFYTSFIEGNYDYNFYDIHYGTYGLECLTEEEFDLLKRYFNEQDN